LYGYNGQTYRDGAEECMAKGRFLKTDKKVPLKEPDYVRTTPYDGGKYIDAEAFFKNAEIQKQLKWFEGLEKENGSQQEQSDS